MLSSINGIDLLLVFIIIGVWYYASICSDNYDITKRKLDESKIVIKKNKEDTEYQALRIKELQNKIDELIWASKI